MDAAEIFMISLTVPVWLMTILLAGFVIQYFRDTFFWNNDDFDEDDDFDK